MWAIGSHEITRPSSGNSIIWSKPLMPATRFACVSWTPLGGPVVPEV